MDVIRKKIADLSPNTKNVRRHNQAQVRELAKAVKTFGIIRPIICDENGVILCGHGLYEALQVNGEEYADCVVMSGLSEKEKTKLMLADNKIYELGSNDYQLIDEILGKFGQEGDFEIPGYNSDTLEDLYGIRSVEKSAQQGSIGQIPTPEAISPTPVSAYSAEQSANVHQDAHGETPVEIRRPTPPQSVVEEREKAKIRNMIICPHCGGTINL